MNKMEEKLEDNKGRYYKYIKGDYTFTFYVNDVYIPQDYMRIIANVTHNGYMIVEDLHFFVDNLKIKTSEDIFNFNTLTNYLDKEISILIENKIDKLDEIQKEIQSLNILQDNL